MSTYRQIEQLLNEPSIKHIYLNGLSYDEFQKMNLDMMILILNFTSAIQDDNQSTTGRVQRLR